MEQPCADEPAACLLGILFAAARRRPLRLQRSRFYESHRENSVAAGRHRVRLPEGEVLHAVDRVDRECARIERQHEGAEHTLVLVRVRFTSDPEVLDDGRVLDVVPVLRRR